MKVLFKDDQLFFYIKDDTLKATYIPSKLNDINLDNIKHLKDVKPLYHYRDKSGKLFPVYYESGMRYITCYGGDVYDIGYIYAGDVKDYTLVNLRLV